MIIDVGFPSGIITEVIPLAEASVSTVLAHAMTGFQVQRSGCLSTVCKLLGK